MENYAKWGGIPISSPVARRQTEVRSCSEIVRKQQELPVGFRAALVVVLAALPSVSGCGSTGYYNPGETESAEHDEGITIYIPVEGMGGGLETTSSATGSGGIGGAEMTTSTTDSGATDSGGTGGSDTTTSMGGTGGSDTTTSMGGTGGSGGVSCIPSNTFRYPLDFNGQGNPVSQNDLCDPYGWRFMSPSSKKFHHGEDVEVPIGTPVYAMAPGFVKDVVTQWESGHNQTRVKIRHTLSNAITLSNGITLPAGSKVYTSYSHLSSVPLNANGDPLYLNQNVDNCTIIGYSGKDNGPEHLHAEIRLDPGTEDHSVNPLEFLPFVQSVPFGASIPAASLDLDSLNPSFVVKATADRSALAISGIRGTIFDNNGTPADLTDDFVVESFDYDLYQVSQQGDNAYPNVFAEAGPYTCNDPTYTMNLTVNPTAPVSSASTRIEAEVYGPKGSGPQFMNTTTYWPQ